MKKLTQRFIRIVIGVVAGFVVLIGAIWALSKTIGNDGPVAIHGQMLELWEAQVNAKDAVASNQANAVLNTEIIPRLEDQMFHDTNDSQLRISLVNHLNSLPGIQYIVYSDAPTRRGKAAKNLGDFGPAAKASIPALIQAAQGVDEAVHEAALGSLGEIHSEPDIVIPFLSKYLDDDNLNDEAATALGKFGGLAQSAVPKILPLLHVADHEVRAAAAEALSKIDPTALTNATNGRANN